MRLRNNPKAYDIMEENSDLVILSPIEYKGRFKSIFDKVQPLHIEIGMGKGDFIYEMALKNPNINFIGIEKFPSVLAAAINKMNKKDKIILGTTDFTCVYQLCLLKNVFSIFKTLFMKLHKYPSNITNHYNYVPTIL